MASSLFKNLPNLGRQNTQTQPASGNDVQSQFRTFLGTYGNCDPAQQLNTLVSQGEITQEHYNWAIQTAQQMAPVLAPVLKMFGR